jgi:hypothetical protein
MLHILPSDCLRLPQVWQILWFRATVLVCVDSTLEALSEIVVAIVMTK